MSVWTKRGNAESTLAASRLLDVLARVGDGTPAVVSSYEVRQLRDPLLMTAYFEPELPARPRPDATFRYPIYKRPPDLDDVVPYPSRAEIEAGALAGRGLELAWTDDPLGLFLLHVQGSGRLRLDDGRIVPIQFAGTNGRPYTALGRVMIDEGMLTREEATVPGIRRVMATLSPSERAALLARNERYVFFRFGHSGPVGSLGVELTPGRSIAADPKLIPPGTLVYVVTPTARRFAVAHDTGAAIKGAHIDLFVGAGEDAELFAGQCRERGTLYVLTPR